jgi:hypothetical protein
LFACDNSTSTRRIEKDTSAQLNELTDSADSDLKIRNNIQLKTKDVIVSQAFLMYADGSLVPQSNETTVNRAVKIRFVVDEGWVENNGRVSLGAAEKIQTNDGRVILDEKDLFRNSKHIDANDSHFITLTANVSKMEKSYEYLTVSFRVWDKNGSGEITGNYRLYVK